MPQQPPFLFLDSAELADDCATGSYLITGREDFLAGHFPGNPVFPASIMLEALGQLAIFYLIKYDLAGGETRINSSRIFFTSTDGVRCTRICRPGDRLDFSVKLKRIRHPLGMFEGRVEVGGQPAAFAEKISLTFDYLNSKD